MNEDRHPQQPWLLGVFVVLVAALVLIAKAAFACFMMRGGVLF